MSEIKLNKELISALENCKDAKEIMVLAKANGVILSEEKAKKIREMLGSEALTDEELDVIVGGQDPDCTCDKEDYSGIKEFRKKYSDT